MKNPHLRSVILYHAGLRCRNNKFVIRSGKKYTNKEGWIILGMGKVSRDIFHNSKILRGLSRGIHGVLGAGDRIYPQDASLICVPGNSSSTYQSNPEFSRGSPFFSRASGAGVPALKSTRRKSRYHSAHVSLGHLKDISSSIWNLGWLHCIQSLGSGRKQRDEH